MKVRALVGAALTGAVVLVSCTQDQTSAPSLSPTEASSARNTPVSFCSFSTITSTARDYFASRTDPVYGLIDAMSSAHRAGGAAAATSAGFNVLARLGAAADAGGSVLKSTATSANGSAFANAVLKCMSVTGFTPAEGTVIDFASALGANGLFAVRSNAQSNAVTSRGLDENNAPLFGAEPTTTGTSSNWPIKITTSGTDAVSPSGKALFYGWKTLESSATLNSEDLSSVAFELKTLPAPLTFSPKIRVGVCSMDDVDARTIHKHASQVSILAPGGTLGFCPTTVSSVSPSLGGFALATRQLASWLSPKPAFAAPLFRGGGGAGLVDGLSEFGAVEYDAAITWTVPPVQRTSLTTSPQFSPTVTLTVKTAKGTPYVGTVILNVVGNSGSFAISGNDGQTNASGVVTFPALYINKAGGYTMTAATGIGTSAPVTFWINGQ